MLQFMIRTNFPFMKHRFVGYLISGGLVLATAVWLVMNGGPRYSVDFTGGTLLQVRTSRVLNADEVRGALEAGGMQGVELQQLGGEHRDEFMIRTRATGEQQDLYATAERAIKARVPDVQVELRRAEAVGPKVGNELRSKAFWAILGSLGGILLYVGFRYEFKYALGAVVALFHDVFVTLGFLCFTGREVSLTVLAALLTIAGFSINDTIVVFDRIREVRGKNPHINRDMINLSLNQTLARTLLTGLSVMIVLVILYFFGGQGLHGFAFALWIGVVAGTYSSIFIATPLLLWMARFDKTAQAKSRAAA
jgi:preprotein translocase SecF subunit